MTKYKGYFGNIIIKFDLKFKPDQPILVDYAGQIVSNIKVNGQKSNSDFSSADKISIDPDFLKKGQNFLSMSFRDYYEYEGEEAGL